MADCKHPDCFYRRGWVNISCDYAIITGKKRPCPAGECRGVYVPSRLCADSRRSVPSLRPAGKGA